MVALKGYQIESFLAKPGSEVAAVLIYGPDRGLVCERSDLLSKNFLGAEVSSDSVISLNPKDLLDNPGQLTELVSSSDFFASNQVFRIRGEATRLEAQVKVALESITPENLLIIEASNLTPTSALRKLFEKESNCRAIACYTDEAKDLVQLVDQVLEQFGNSINPSDKQSLTQLLGGDRMFSRQQLEKLCLYVGSGNEITSDDIKMVMEDGAHWSVDELYDAVGSADIEMADKIYAKAIYSGVSPDQILLGLQRHFTSLHNLVSVVENGVSVSSALLKARPPIFFKRKQIMEQQCRIWHSKALTETLTKIYQGLHSSRISNINTKVMASNIVYDIAYQAYRLKSVR